MNSAVKELEAARAARDAARDAFDTRLEALRGDPDAETIGQRLVSRLGRDARNSLEQALDIASESKGIIAATLAALALWLLRHPILDVIADLRAGADDADDLSDTTQEVPTDA